MPRQLGQLTYHFSVTLNNVTPCLFVVCSGTYSLYNLTIPPTNTRVIFILILQIRKLKENCHQYNDHYINYSLLPSIPLDLIARGKQHLSHLRQSSPQKYVYQYKGNVVIFSSIGLNTQHRFVTKLKSTVARGADFKTNSHMLSSSQRYYKTLFRT